MDIATSVWQIAIIALIAGALIGALLYRLFSPSVKQSDKIKTDLQQARAELASYKISVGEHFDKTSELVDDLAKNYVRVYQHLAKGAQTLGDSKSFNKLLEPHQGQVSIAVDDSANIATDGSIADPLEKKDLPAESVDEHAEPSGNVAKDSPSAENLAQESTQDEVSKSPDKIDEVDVAEAPAKSIDTDASAETEDATPKGSKKTS